VYLEQRLTLPRNCGILTQLTVALRSQPPQMRLLVESRSA